MNEDKLAKLTALMDLFDTKSNIEEFVAVFSQVVEYLKTNQDQTAESVLAIIKRLDEMGQQMQSDNKEDLNRVKGLVADAIASLRISLEEKVSETEARVSERLSTIKDGRDGRDGRDGIGKDGLPGKDGSPDTPDQVVEKINTSSLLIKKERVEGLIDLIRNMAANAMSVGITTTNFFKNGTLVGRAKNINIIEGNNITATMYQSGDQMNINLTSTASGSGNFATEEIPTGTVNGVNVTFTLAHTPVVGSQKVYVNGARQKKVVGLSTMKH